MFKGFKRCISKIIIKYIMISNEDERILKDCKNEEATNIT